MLTHSQSPSVASNKTLFSGHTLDHTKGKTFRCHDGPRLKQGNYPMFCDPQAPWQKSAAENLNKRARRYLPRDTLLAAPTNRYMKAIFERLNGTPRKCLGWRTPTEVFGEEMMKPR